MPSSTPYAGSRPASVRLDPLPTIAVSVITDISMVHTVMPLDLPALIASRDVDLIDVREQHEWDTGHIAGARLVPLERFRADPEAALVRGRTIVFICAKGVRSMAAAKLAERFGYSDVYNLEGGTKEWARVGLPLAIDERVAA
jgi:rhodanese-related sulfurtransferase